MGYKPTKTKIIILIIIFLVFMAFLYSSLPYPNISIPLLFSSLKPLLPFIFIIPICAIFFSSSKIAADTLLAVLGIFFALIFFVFNEYYQDLSIIRTLQAVDVYNCNLVSVFQEGINIRPTKLIYGKFYTDFYSRNLGLISDVYGTATLQRFMLAIYDMDSANDSLSTAALISVGPHETITQSTGIDKSIGIIYLELNKEIFPSISDDFCKYIASNSPSLTSK